MRDHSDDEKITITLDDNMTNIFGNSTYTIDTNYTNYTITDSTISTIDWNFESNTNGKYIDFDVLDKYPTAKTLYNQFISVYNMCEEEEKLNGE
jgi:hypothetical protein